MEQAKSEGYKASPDASVVSKTAPIAAFSGTRAWILPRDTLARCDNQHVLRDTSQAQVEMLVVGDDCALPYSRLVGRRGIAGTVFVHKVLIRLCQHHSCWTSQSLLLNIQHLSA